MLVGVFVAVLVGLTVGVFVRVCVGLEVGVVVGEFVAVGVEVAVGVFVAHGSRPDTFTPQPSQTDTSPKYGSVACANA